MNPASGQATPTIPPSAWAGRRTVLGLAGLATLGGFCATMVEQNLVIGAAVYYALLGLALASPQAAPLRRAAFARRNPAPAAPPAAPIEAEAEAT